jgi:hypothetical protein
MTNQTTPLTGLNQEELQNISFSETLSTNQIFNGDFSRILNMSAPVWSLSPSLSG